MTSKSGIPLGRRDEAWERLVLAAQRCGKCPLAPGRKNVVFGDGDRSTRLLFIGRTGDGWLGIDDSLRRISAQSTCSRGSR